MVEKARTRRLNRSQTSKSGSTSTTQDTSDMSMCPTLEDSQHIRVSRKRAAKACDQCRRRKSRCDGQLECGACQVVGLQCSFGERLKQARGPQYVAHLEQKVEKLEEQIRRASIASETSAQDLASASQSPLVGDACPISPTTTSLEQRSLSSVPSSVPNSFGTFSNAYNHTTTSENTRYLGMITSEPRGKPFGIDVLRQLWNLCNHIASPAVSNRPESSIKLVQALDAQPLIDSFVSSSNPLLPPKAHLVSWTRIAFAEAFHLWPFVSRSHIEQLIYRMYNTNTFGQDENDRDDLALLYALLALGQRFDASANMEAQWRRTQGLAYFAAARDMVPLSHCDRNLTALQTVLCMALYLKAGSAQMRAHAYISAAASAALRMGLHEQVPCFAQEEIALRQRLWSTICVLDVVCSTSLGIPRTISVSMGKEELFPGPLSTLDDDELVPVSAHVDLIRILGEATDKAHAGSGIRRPIGLGSNIIPAKILQDACNGLKIWARSNLALSAPIENMRTSQLQLSYSYSYVQLLLFSPFIHHLALPIADKTSIEFAYGVKCMQAAVHAINVAAVLQKDLNLSEAYFITLDTLAFAATTLLVIELGSTDDVLLAEAIKAGKRAKELLLVLSLQSQAAAECWEALSVCWSYFKIPPRNLPADDATLALQQAGKLSSARSQQPARRPNLVPFDSGIDLKSPEESSVSTQR